MSRAGPEKRASRLNRASVLGHATRVPDGRERRFWRVPVGREPEPDTRCGRDFGGAERPLSTCDIRSGAEPEQTQSEMQTKRFAVRAIRVPGAATGGMVGRSSMLCELPGGELVGEPLNGAHGDGLRVAHAAGEHSVADVGVGLD